jgi:DNA (cytosine-5)-methyltransferase 1
MLIKKLINKNHTVLDLFCGCGGLSLGFEMMGFDILLGIDSWHESLVTFKNNHINSQTICADLSNLSPLEVQKKILKNGVDVIIGGPPCQGFSISGKRDADDPRNKLYRSFVSFVKHFEPQAFIMENVPNLVSMNGGKIKDDIITEFEQLGYNVSYKIMVSSDFGVPQNRKRVFFVGLRNGKKFEFPNGKFIEKKITAYEAISDLPEQELEDGTKYIHPSYSDYQTLMRHGSKEIFNHQTTKHSEKTKEIISLVPDGGNYKNLPSSLQNTRKVNIAWTRLNSAKPSFTIDTGHNHHFHYKFDRVPTARESARIQSFPDSFIFYGKKNDQLKQIGNAVPPLLGKEIANKLKFYLD